MKCGLLGGKLSHSYSPQIHAHLGDYSYELFEKNKEELDTFLRTADFDGINVTIPYKKDVIPYCAKLSGTAKRLGAVNTVVKQPDGTLWGHNTDYFGFETMLKKSGLSVCGKKVLVLGSGGAAQTAIAVLQDHGAKVVVVSRSGENNYSNLQKHTDAAFIINCTPVGMYPNNGVSPVNIAQFPQLEGVLDMIYNPAKTKLLLDAEAKGVVSMNGLLMLVAQAKESAEWFTNATIADEKIQQIHRLLRQQMENIILIGMPGSGKSTVGALLAQSMGKEFVDADAYLAQKAGRSIPEIFAADGEETFRKLETETLAELGRRSGIILATGGGCVTRPENYAHLHQNGTIFCIHRDLSLLDTDGRPISQSSKLTDLFAIRKPLYERFADYHIDNNAAAEAAAAEIQRIWEGAV